MSKHDISTRTFADVQTSFLLSSGDYIFMVSRADYDNNPEKGQEWFELRLTPTQIVNAERPEDFDGEEWDDAALGAARPVSYKFWLHTEGAKRVSLETLSFVFGYTIAELKETPWDQILEAITKQELKARVVRKVSEKGNPFVDVERLYPAA